MFAGTPPIRATKARYFEDAQLMEPILPYPIPQPASAAVNPSSDDWSSCIVAATNATAPATTGAVEGDPANAGIRREPELPAHEEIVAPPHPPEQEFNILDDEPDVDAAKSAQCASGCGWWRARQDSNLRPHA